MIIKGYRDQPLQFAPDPGEIIYARRSAQDKFTLAVVEKAWRNRAGNIRVRVMWLDDDPDASPGEKDRNDRDGSQAVSKGGHVRPVKAYETGWLTMREPMGESPLIRQVNRDSLPRQQVSERGAEPAPPD